MKSKYIIISAAWIVSLSIAYIVGAKIQGSNNEEETAGTSENARSYYRANSSSSSPESRKNSSASNTISAQAASSSKFDISTIINQDDPIYRVQNLLALINQLGPSDFEQVVADFRASGLTRDRMSEYGMLLHAWAKSDPLSALDYAEKNTDSPYARQTILASWATDNPSAALQWAKTHHEGEGANPWLIGVIRGIAKTDPSRATEIMATLPYSRERGDALATIVPHIVKGGQDKALVWLNSISDDRLRGGATAYVARNLAEQDPEATASWATAISNDDERQRAIGEVADTWADNDVASAVAWTETLQGADKTRAASQLIGEYTRESPEQASRWLDSMAGKDGYDSIARGFIWNTARNNPELSLSKVATLTNTRSQPRYYSRILSNWHRSDASAAAAWMDANNVSQDIRRRATQPRRNN